ncbi:UNVERIFIED_CONTAM: hypothetical protein Slati_0011400 [Sesamum latifolium]|uniref:Retrovirus-related Pol polyprotein from transposon TNT 1-94-like beta-barrel domain-containing protein n=1 Tax=Sesamum latifolium TaxID=2727402 RepID=A0AAW2Y603_9LAMI
MVVPVTKTLPDLSKLELLDETNYKRWSQMLFIFFEQLDMDYVLFQNPPKTPTEASTLAITPAGTSVICTSVKSEDEAKQKCDRDNKIVRGRLLNHMNNSLFDLFVNYRSAKEIWTTLETRYGGDDAGRKKYVVDILSECMKMCEISRANVLLEKFSPTWSEYPNHLKHKKRDLTLQELIGHMQTKQANRLKDNGTSLSSLSIKVNLVQSVGSKDRKDQQKANQKPATQATPQVNLAEKDEIIIAVVVEANLVDKKDDWVLDTGASRHFYSNKALFHELLDATDDECVFMGNSTTAGVLDKGKIFLKLTFGKY